MTDDKISRNTNHGTRTAGTVSKRELARRRARAREITVPNPNQRRPGIERARDLLGHTYPIDRAPGDKRFSNALLNEVAEVLERRGYPVVRPGRDMTRLMEALYRFVYRRPV